MQAFIFSVQIPFLSASQVIHEAVIILLHDHADVLDSRIDHAGDLEINDPEPCRNGKRRDGPQHRQFPQTGVILTRIDNSHDVFHLRIVLSSTSQNVVSGST